MNPKPVFFVKGSHPPVSNTERQREFRERNPGYYQRLHAKRKAAMLARAAQREAAEAKVILTIPVPTWRLALPAPVVDPVMIEFNAMVERLARARELVPIARSASA